MQKDGRGVRRRVGKEMFGLLIFPGVLSLAFCGAAALFLEGWLGAALYGGGGPRPRDLAGVELGGRAWPAGELAAAAAAAAAMGAAAVMLVGARGDLLALALLFPAAEMLPLAPLAARGLERSLHLPLLFRTALRRTLALSCLLLAVSLRLPGEFSPGIGRLREQGVLAAVRGWEGAGFAFAGAAMACAGIALLLILLGRPAGAERRPRGAVAAIYAAALEGPQRSVGLLLFVLLFLGYPRGGGGALLWSAAALGTVVLLAAARAWVEGRGPLVVVRLQAAAAVASLFSLALAFAAAVIAGS